MAGLTLKKSHIATLKQWLLLDEATQQGVLEALQGEVLVLSLREESARIVARFSNRDASDLHDMLGVLLPFWAVRCIRQGSAGLHPVEAEWLHANLAEVVIEFARAYTRHRSPQGIITDIEQALRKLEETATPLEAIQFDLDRYLYVVDTYSEEFLEPTLYSVIKMELLLRAVQRALVVGDIFPDGMGGIRIEWAAPHKTLNLMVPGDLSEREYLYHGERESYGVEYNPTPETIAKYLTLLSADA